LWLIRWWCLAWAFRGVRFIIIIFRLRITIWLRILVALIWFVLVWWVPIELTVVEVNIFASPCLHLAERMTVSVLTYSQLISRTWAYLCLLWVLGLVCRMKLHRPLGVHPHSRYCLTFVRFNL
jgi:hypothetical protein